VIDMPITEHGFTGMAVGAAFTGLKPIVEFMTFNFLDAGDRPHHQQRRQDALHERRPARLPDRLPRPERRGARVAAQHSQDYSAWYAQIPG
jgi:pyruvate dehydrogenase E1 component beta subunit